MLKDLYLIHVNHKIILHDTQAPSKYFYLLRYFSQATTSL